MSREHAALQHRIWRDKEFTSQEPDAILAYLFLLSQPDLSYAGALHLRPRQWARMLPTLNEDRLRAAIDTLAANRFVLVDEDTEELLIRTFVRNDELWKMPRMLELAIKQAEAIESVRLRKAFGVELLRILPRLKRDTDKQRQHAALVLAAAEELAPGVVSPLAATPEPSLEPPPPATPESVPAEPLPQGMAQPPGVGAGAGAPAPTSPQTPRKRGATQASPANGCDRHSRPRRSCPDCHRLGELAAVPPQCDECGPGRMRENDQGQPFHCPTCHPVALARPGPLLRVVGGDG